MQEENQRWRIVTGSDGALWFTEGPFDGIGRITTSGQVTRFPLPFKGSYPFAIASGPDGALWYTMDAQRIGRISTAGFISEYPLPTEGGPQGANIWSEIANASGTLWIGRWARGIDRVTTAGIVTEMLFLTSPTSIVAGPDEAVWFTDANGSIGRISVNGSRTSFPLPQNYPHSMTVGPDGALWFTTDQPPTFHARIGRMTTSGVITYFDLSSSGVFANRIVAGPDGALWFTVFQASKIGRISTEGIITMYDVPGGGPNGFNDLTLGPDAALWIVGGGASIVQVIVRQTDTMTIKNYKLVSSQPAAGGKSYLTYRADFVNGNNAFGLVTATLKNADPFKVRILPEHGVLSFTPVPPNRQVTSGNTFTIIADAGEPVELSKLQWTLAMNPAPPLAVPGANQSVSLASNVTLDGGGSKNPSGVGTLSYNWRFTSRPSGTRTTLLYSTTTVARFVADVRGTYVLTLTVTNGIASSTQTVTVVAR